MLVWSLLLMSSMAIAQKIAANPHNKIPELSKIFFYNDGAKKRNRPFM